MLPCYIYFFLFFDYRKLLHTTINLDKYEKLVIIIYYNMKEKRVAIWLVLSFI